MQIKIRRQAKSLGRPLVSLLAMRLRRGSGSCINLLLPLRKKKDRKKIQYVQESDCSGTTVCGHTSACNTWQLQNTSQDTEI
jgi:hypothetical protein